MPSTRHEVNHLAVITGVILLLWHMRSQSILILIFDAIAPRVTNITSAILLAIFYCYSNSTASIPYISQPVTHSSTSKIVYIAVGTNPVSVSKHE
uniref:P10 protein n=1 Tax=Soybean yellow mottle mosaic virus TaxID=578361 RepID=A0A7D5LTG4_9TOMB|nr:P10 protein [Soybean yellow mottle mosaic virus]